MIHLLAWLAIWALVTLIPVLRGVRVPASALRVHATYSASAVLFLAAMHHLDGVAERTLAAFRPVIQARYDAGRGRLPPLLGALTTMPRRAVLLIMVLGIGASLALAPFAVPAMRAYRLASSPLAVALDAGFVSTLGSATFGSFICHAVRQLRIVSKICSRYPCISLFRLQAVYGLYPLTARTALVLVAIGALAMSTRGPAPGRAAVAQTWPDPMTVGLGYLTVSVTTAAAVFAAPLTGLHQRLNMEKASLAGRNDRRVGETLEEIHRRIDDGRLDGIDGLKKALASLLVEREVINNTPTWPWSPGAF